MWLVDSYFFVVEAVIVTDAICGCYYVCCKGRGTCGATYYYTEEEDGGVCSCVDGVGSCC